MNYEAQIKSLKTQYNTDVIEKAKSEERLKALEEKKEDILKACKAKGVEPEDLPQKIKESQDKLDTLIEKANSLFGNPSDGVSESPF